jgi:DmsE family decaheme c-type cytochrome
MTRASAVKYSLLVLIVVALTGILVFGPPGLRAQNPPKKAAPAQSGSINNEDCAACHDDVVKAFDRNPHAILEKSKQYSLKNSCESCHGPGQAHMDGSGDKTKIVTFKEAEGRKYNEMCLSCHKKNRELVAFNGSRHSKGALNCADCHNIHNAARATPLLKEAETPLCLRCHTSRRADFAKPYHHRVKEGAMKCSDCHQPHSGLERRQIRNSTVGDAICTKCHTSTEGPFVFEHAPTKIHGCLNCHEPHGSINAKMLVRTTVRQLCLECHTKNVGVLGSQPPSFHDVTNIRYQNCTTCHVKIHGSNASRLLLR